MAKVKEISVLYSRTVNLGNFESLRIELGEVVTLDAKDKAESVRAEVFAAVKKEVGAIVRAVKEKSGVK